MVSHLACIVRTTYYSLKVLDQALPSAIPWLVRFTGMEGAKITAPSINIYSNSPFPQLDLLLHHVVIVIAAVHLIPFVLRVPRMVLQHMINNMQSALCIVIKFMGDK